MPSVALVWTAQARACLAKRRAFLMAKQSVAVRRAMGIAGHRPRQGQRAGRGPERRPAEELAPEHRELFVPFGAAGHAVPCSRDQEAEAAILALRQQLNSGK